MKFWKRAKQSKDLSVVWKMSVPSTAFLQDVVFEKHSGRKCTLIYSYESKKDSSVIFERLIFDGVESFKCTYFRACSIEMINAYDKIVDVGRSDWLLEVTENLLSSNANTSGLKHFRIYFDDGPCYEFICRSFQVVNEEHENPSVNNS